MAMPDFTIEEIEAEEWRDVVGYEGIYRVSTLGRIKRIKAWGTSRRSVGHCLKPGANTGGYLYVNLYKNGSHKPLTVHKIVAATFLGPRPVGYQVNHIDANPQNPRLSNLEYVTPKENVQHAVRLGNMRGPRGPQPNRRGENSAVAKLMPRDIVAIRRAILDGVSGNALAEQHKVSAMTISLIKTGRVRQYITELLQETIALGKWKTRTRG